MAALASIEALEARLGHSLEGVELGRAQAALDDASALIRSEAGSDFDGEVPDVVASICLAVAYRAFRNPDGTTQTSIGDVSISFKREGVGGAVWLSQAERRAIRKAAGLASAQTVVLTTPYIGESKQDSGLEWWETGDE